MYGAPLPLSISYLNIHGLHGALGCKIPELTNILINDINVLAETWTCDHDKNIQNFEYIELSPNKMTGKNKGRSSGGLIIYYKLHLRSHIKIIRKQKTHIWLEIDKQILLNTQHNLKVCFTYIPPEDSLYYSNDSFDELINDILEITNDNEDYLIMGDFNARTHSLIDHVPVNKHSDADLDLVNTSCFIPRQNCDQHCPNQHGRNLINLCRSANLRILNGRKLGDSRGNFTCFTHNGASTADYGLCSQELFNKIILFHVGQQTEYSDHCKITIEIPSKQQNEANAPEYRWKKLEPNFLWEENSKTTFQTSLHTEEILSLLSSLKDQIQNNQTTELLGLKLNDIFLKSAKISLRTKPINKNSVQNKHIRHKKWFDKDCRDQKSKLNRFSKLKHSSPQSEYLRLQYREQLKCYKKQCLQKRQTFWNNCLSKLQTNSAKQNFWDTWKEFDENIKQESVAIKDGNVWEKYFSILFSSSSDNNDPVFNNDITSNPNSTLNIDFTMEEINDAIRKLKTNKSPGIDKISNEMIKNASLQVIEMIRDIFNLLLRRKAVPKTWCIGLITPIYKKGNRMDPNNYRGICVGNALLKLFCTILNQRLIKYINENNIINKCQIGFKKNCRTTDHILTLKALINKHVKDKSKKKVHAAFIDFAKAFDSVWHKGLFHKLQKNGINGNFLELLQNIYENTECAVKIGSQHTNFFKCLKGVRQGCPLSPTLFNIFMDDLVTDLNNANTAPLQLENEPITCLLYADDIIILSSTHTGLQNCLDALHEYCKKWKLSINKSKSKCMTFYKNCSKYKHKFSIDNTELQNVTEFTYLGITLDAACSFKQTLQLLSSKATRAIFALNSRYKIKYLPIVAALKLFDSTISPILLYGSEVWGAFEISSPDQWDKSSIEKVHTQFLKRLLGVNRSTTNFLVRGELGRYPLLTQIESRICNFIKHIENDYAETSLVSQAFSYENKILNRKSMSSHVEELSTLLRNNHFINSPLVSLSKNSIKKIINSYYSYHWKSKMDECSKATLYKTHKQNISLEKYLIKIKKRKVRSTITKIRLSDHCLAIEKGRHSKPKTEKHHRICRLCNENKIEDEIHFTMQCKTFTAERKSFNSNLIEICPNYKNIPTDEQKYIFLQTNEDNCFLELFGEYIFTIYNKRLQFHTDIQHS